MSLQIILVALNACLLKAIEFFPAVLAYRAAVCCAVAFNQHNFSYVDFFSPETLSVSRFAELTWNYGYKSYVTRKQAAVSSVPAFQCLFIGQSRILRVLECQFFKCCSGKLLLIANFTR